MFTLTGHDTKPNKAQKGVDEITSQILQNYRLCEQSLAFKCSAHSTTDSIKYILRIINYPINLIPVAVNSRCKTKNKTKNEWGHKSLWY